MPLHIATIWLHKTAIVNAFLAILLAFTAIVNTIAASWVVLIILLKHFTINGLTFRGYVFWLAVKWLLIVIEANASGGELNAFVGELIAFLTKFK